MRHFLIAACFVGLSLGLTTAGKAESASDCGMICNITSYLASDHMSTAPTSDAAAGGAPKAHHAHVASHKPAAHTPAKLAAAGGASKVAPKTAAALKVTTAPKIITRTVVAPKAVMAKAEPARRASTKPAKPALQPEAVLKTATPIHVAATTSRPAEATHVRLAKSQRAKVVSASDRPVSAKAPQPEQRTAFAVIPGSAPTIQAAFTPVGMPTLH